MTGANEPGTPATPYARGWAAFCMGLPETANPHDLATDEAAYLDWLDGWHAADEPEGEDGA